MDEVSSAVEQFITYGPKKSTRACCGAIWPPRGLPNGSPRVPAVRRGSAHSWGQLGLTGMSCHVAVNIFIHTLYYFDTVSWEAIRHVPGRSSDPRPKIEHLTHRLVLFPDGTGV